MNKIAIVTDSTAALPADIVEKFQISVAPLLLIWGSKTYLDGVDIKPSEFYKMLPQNDITPSTSQATVATFIEIFNHLVNEDKDILVITISSKLSGTLDSAVQAKKHFPNANIEIVDSLSASVPLQILVTLAIKAINNGASLLQAKALVEKAVPKMRVFFAVETLEYLHKGGRIGGAARFLGTALGLKPILELQNGQIEAIDKIRTTKKAHSRLVELVEENIDKNEKVISVGIIDADAEEGAQYLSSELMQRYHTDEIIFGTLSPVLGAHTGPGTVGVAVLAGLEDDLIK